MRIPNVSAQLLSKLSAKWEATNSSFFRKIHKKIGEDKKYL